MDSGTVRRLPDPPDGCLTLTLLVLGVFADDHHPALALDDFALFANGLHRRTNLHASFLLRYPHGNGGHAPPVRGRVSMRGKMG